MNLALFDFDGTITVSDTWAPFIRFATRPTRLLAGQVLLSPVTIAYLLGADNILVGTIGFVSPTAVARLNF